MATTALGIAPDDEGRGVDPLTHRRIIMGHWSNTGIISGSRTSGGDGDLPLAVTGRNDLMFNIADGSAVCSRGRADGFTEAYWPGGTTSAIKAGDPSHKRYDIVWVKAGDPTQGDNDNHVTVGVTSGTPSSSPQWPISSVPPGATEIASVIVPAGAATTSQCTIMASGDYAVPSGGSLGLICRNIYNYEGPANVGDKGKDYYEQETEFTVPSDRLVEVRFLSTMCCTRPDDPSKPTEDATKFACWYAGIQIDGEEVVGGQFQVSRAWQQYHLNGIHPVTAGKHTVRIRSHRVEWGSPENVFFIAHSDGNEFYPGRTLEVWDRGPYRNANE